MNVEPFCIATMLVQNWTAWLIFN